MTEAIVLLLAGAFAGLLAGFIGIGGGVVLVPALIFLFESKKISPEIITQLAVGTSLASIIFTGSAGSWMHNRKGNIDWVTVAAMAPFIVAGTQVGALIAGGLGGATLKKLFGIFEFFVAARMLLPPACGPAAKPLSPWPLYLSGGLAIGIISSLFGIGGGTLTVPLLVYFLDRPIKTAVGTSSAQGVVIALFGTIGFVYQGWSRAGLPDGAWGYVLPHLALLIALGSTVTAPFGALLAHRIEPVYISRFFGIFLIFVGMRLIGLF